MVTRRGFLGLLSSLLGGLGAARAAPVHAPAPERAAPVLLVKPEAQFGTATGMIRRVDLRFAQGRVYKELTTDNPALIDMLQRAYSGGFPVYVDEDGQPLLVLRVNSLEYDFHGVARARLDDWMPPLESAAMGMEEFLYGDLGPWQ